MQKTLAVLATCVLVLTPICAKAEMRTIKIDGETVSYVVTEPQRGAGPTREEILDMVQKSEPVRPVMALPPSGGSDKPVKR
jgi:hypothetical protein